MSKVMSQKEIVSVAKYEIKPAFDMDAAPFFGLLRDIRHENFTVSNNTSRLYFIIQQQMFDAYQQTGAWPDEKTVCEGRGVDGYIYNRLVATQPTIGQTANLNQLIRDLCMTYKKIKTAVLRGQASIPSYRLRQPIALHNASWSVAKDPASGKYIASASLIGKARAKEMGRKNGVFSFVIEPGDASRKAILDKICSGEYKKSASKLLEGKHGKWFLNLAFRHAPEVVAGLDPDKVLGVDIGVRAPVTMAVGWETRQIKGKEVEEYRGIVARRRDVYQNAASWAEDASVGHGYVRRMRDANLQGNRAANFRDNINHKYANAVVRFAVQRGCGVIQLRDISGIRAKGDLFLQDWTYFDLQEKIKYKARAAGIEVRMVGAPYTSQRCFKCGHVSENNCAPCAPVFTCEACGFTSDSDKNAARNVALPDIDQLVSSAVKRRKGKAS